MAIHNLSDIGQPGKVPPETYVEVAHALAGVRVALSVPEIAAFAGVPEDIASRALHNGLTPQGLAHQYGHGAQRAYAPTDRITAYLGAVNTAAAAILIERRIVSTEDFTARAIAAFAIGYGIPNTRGLNAAEVGELVDPTYPAETVIWRGLLGLMAVQRVGSLRLHGLGIRVSPYSLDASGPSPQN